MECKNNFKWSSIENVRFPTGPLQALSDQEELDIHVFDYFDFDLQKWAMEKLSELNTFKARKFYHICWSEAEFKEFEQRFTFKPRLKFGWFHLNLYWIFQDLNRRSIETGALLKPAFGGFETRLKFIKFGHWLD